MTLRKVARDAEERGEGICRTCLARIWNEGGKIRHRQVPTGWSDRVVRGGDSLVCFKARDYRHVPLAGREAEIYDSALAGPLAQESGHEGVARIVKVARDSEAWFARSADTVLERIKTESTEDVTLYHDAVSVLVFARDLVRLVAQVPVDERERG